MRPATLRHVRRRLLAWFDTNRRDMPWRRTRDPYRILVVEYMLQRTRVATGTAFYERFLEAFPDVRSLAEASEDEVLRVWEGLGFYRRARDLHAAARAIVEHHEGHVPTTFAELEALPGVGPYTAGAVASIAFGRRVPALDGNAGRVLARLCRIDDITSNRGRRKIREIAVSLVQSVRPGTINEAIMELGATVCHPASPACGTCPLAEFCLARKAGLQDSLPTRPRPRTSRTVPVAFALIREDERVLFVRRPNRSLLGGLWSLPGGELPSGVEPRIALRDLVRDQTGVDVRVGDATMPIAHVFSHRAWSGDLYRCVPSNRLRLASEARWVTPTEMRDLPLVPFHRHVVDALGPRRSVESGRSSRR